MAEKNIRTIETFTPVALDTGVRRQMPLGQTEVAFHFRLTGTLTVGVAVATILEDSPYGFIRSLQCVLNSNFPLFGQGLHGRFYSFWTRWATRTAARVTAPSGAVGASNFVAEWSMYFGQADLLPPNDRAFWLDTRLLARVEHVYDFGQATDVATAGGGGTVALSNLLLAVSSEEVADRGGPASKMQFSRILQPISATGLQNFPQGGLPTLGQAYRALAYHFVSGNADPIRATSDDTILTDVSLVGDNLKRYWDAVRYENLRAENKTLRSLETMPAGWAVLDRAKAGTLGDILFTNRIRSLINTFNVGAAPANTFVEIFPITPLIVLPADQRVRARR